MDSVESAKYEITTFSTCTYSFWTFFPWIRIRIFRIGSGFLSNPDPDLGQKVRSGSGSGKKPDPKYWLWIKGTSNLNSLFILCARLSSLIDWLISNFFDWMIFLFRTAVRRGKGRPVGLAAAVAVGWRPWTLPTPTPHHHHHPATRPCC